MKYNHTNLVILSFFCSILTSSIQATHKQAQELMDQLAIAQVPESEFKQLAEMIKDDANQIDPFVTTSSTLKAVADSSNDLYNANKDKYEGAANKALRDLHNTAASASEKMNSHLKKINRHHKEIASIAQVAANSSKELTQKVHDAFVKAHRELSNSELTKRPAKKTKEVEEKPKKEKKKPAKKVKNKKKKHSDDADFMGAEIA